jgi:dUTPase
MIKLGNIQIDDKCFKKYNCDYNCDYKCEHKVFINNKIELKNSNDIYNMIINYIKNNKNTNIYETDILHFSNVKNIKKEYIINMNGYIEYFPKFSNDVFNEQLYIKKLNEYAIIPTKIEEEQAYNLYSLEDIEILPKSYKFIKTGLSIKFPKNMNIKVIPLFYSSNYWNWYYMKISKEYNELKVLLYNQNETNNLYIKKNDKIGKIIVEKILYPEFEFIELDNIKNIYK